MIRHSVFLSGSTALALQRHGLAGYLSFICLLMNAFMFYVYLKGTVGCSRESTGSRAQRLGFWSSLGFCFPSVKCGDSTGQS